MVAFQPDNPDRPRWWQKLVRFRVVEDAPKSHPAVTDDDLRRAATRMHALRDELKLAEEQWALAQKADAELRMVYPLQAEMSVDDFVRKAHLERDKIRAAARVADLERERTQLWHVYNRFTSGEDGE